MKTAFIITGLAAAAAIRIYSTRKIISRTNTGVYLIRYHLIPNNRYLNVYLHKFIQSDLDDALHDHPWNSVGILLNRPYLEHTPLYTEKWIEKGDRHTKTRIVRPFVLTYRPAEFIHRVELLDKEPVWTFFMTGPWVRDWGFWCDKGFVNNKDFLTKDGQSVGKGCSDDD